MRDDLPDIAITMGDPAGIGPEVLIKAVRELDIAILAKWTVVGSKSQLHRHAKALNLTDDEIHSIRVFDPGPPAAPTLPWGEITKEAGRLALNYIKAGTELCLRGEVEAMVTAPVAKEAVALTGQVFSGHTEYIAELCGTSQVRMLLVNPRLSVIHVTTHRPLRRACQLDTANIVTTIELGDKAMRSLGFKRPRIAVCGLNPHAGENGLFGEEDQRFILPAVRQAQQHGTDCTGPLPADTLFMKAVRGAYDLVVAMYHDQGHVPMKLLDFENTVNVSLGLPIIRTSVDHGTAFDIVGRNLANPQSMKSAMQLAVRLALGQRKLRRQGSTPQSVAEGS